MPDERRCAACGRILTDDDVGASRKLINRGLDLSDCLCLPCLCVRFSVKEPVLRRKIEEWREAGCLLFPPARPGESG